MNVSSDAHYQATGIDFDRLRRPARSIAATREYSVSKLCNVLFTQELARRLAGTGVTAYALHPGVVASDIWRRIPWPVRPMVTRRMLTIDQGARTSLYCATAPELAEVSGKYYDDSAEREPSPVATRRTRLAPVGAERGVDQGVRIGQPVPGVASRARVRVMHLSWRIASVTVITVARRAPVR